MAANIEEVAVPMLALANEQSHKMGIQNNEFEEKSTSYSTQSPEIPTFSPTPNTPSLTRRKSSFVKETRFGGRAVPLDYQTLEKLGETPKLSNQARQPPFSDKVAEASGSSNPKDEKEKEGPDEWEIYKKVTEQLKARRSWKMTVKLVLELLIFLAIFACLICSLKGGIKGKKLWGIEFWKWFALLMAIFSGTLVIGWVVHCIVFFIEWKYFMKKNVVYFTHGLKTNVEVFLWFVVILVTWVVLIKGSITASKVIPEMKRILDFITWTIASLLIGSFLWLVKTTLIKMLASSFHLNRYFGRIQEAVFHHYVLQTLSGKPVVQLALEKAWKPVVQSALEKAREPVVQLAPVESAPKLSRVNSRESTVSIREHIGSHTEKKVVDWNKLHQMKKEKVPSWTMKLLVDVISNSGLSTISSILNKDVVEGGVELNDNEITNEEEAITTAVNIFKNVIKYQNETDDKNGTVDLKNRYIDAGDLHKFLIWKEVELVFPRFEVNEHKQIDVRAFAKWVVQVYKDRLALQHALNDNNTAVDDFNKLLNGLLIIIIIIMWLLLTAILTTKMLLFLSSQLLVAVFVFGNSCKTVFEALIFVFVMHPFDVGDLCVIDETPLLVEEMNILTTVFLKLNNEKVYYPNVVLATKSIGNYYRSPDMVDGMEFAIGYNTPLEKIDKLKAEIKKYVDKTPEYWHPEHLVVVKEIENMNKIKMALFVSHTMNFQDIAERSRRKSELALKMKGVFDQVGISYHLLPQEIHLTSMPQYYPV